MALNYLLYRHQVSVMRAAVVRSPEARAAHLGLAAGYAGQIRDLRAELGVAVVDGPRVS